MYIPYVLLVSIAYYSSSVYSFLPLLRRLVFCSVPKLDMRCERAGNQMHSLERAASITTNKY